MHTERRERPTHVHAQEVGGTLFKDIQEAPRAAATVPCDDTRCRCCSGNQIFIQISFPLPPERAPLSQPGLATRWRAQHSTAAGAHHHVG
jgi:hypothetical protein